MTVPKVVTCGHCGRPLTDPDSRALGYGPVCAAGVLGYDTHRTPVPRPWRRKDVDQIPLPLEKPVDLETRKAAIDTIARHALSGCVEHAGLDWGNYPELDESTWDVVTERVRALVASLRPTAEGYDAAYEHLTGVTAPKTN